MKIGEKIRMIREIKGISQEAIATYLNMSPQAYGKIEREETKLDLDRINEIANYLGITFEDVFNFDKGSFFTSSNKSNNTNMKDFQDGFKIIERLLVTLEKRFEKYDLLLEKNLEIIERFGELIKN